MDRSDKQTNLHSNDTRRSVSVHRNLFRTWFEQPHNYKQSNRGHKRNRHYKYLLPVVAAIVASPVNAETVGGVSATASPIANSSGSVTNQAIQVLQGPYITNTYGAGIQCQGPTRNFTPLVTASASAQRPYEPWYNTPVYDMRDIDEDGAPDNPGAILWEQPTRTGQKDNLNLSVGFSITWSEPLDKKLQDQCKEAAQANISLMQQAHANKRLDFEIARLKNCGQLLQQGIMFHPKSPMAKVCADVVVHNVNHIKPHVHSIPLPSTSESQDSSDAAQLGAEITTGREVASP